MQVTIIGSGNTATVLGRLIKHAGHKITQVYSRNKMHAEDLAEQLDAEPVSSWENIIQHEGLYLVALSDSALTNLSQYWKAEKGLVIHTAGSVSKEILQAVADNFGVLYPLQSLRKEKTDYDTIPLLTDANSNENLATVTAFAESLSLMVRHANDEQRMHLHIGAVVVNNFGNYLFTLTEDYCKKNGAHFNLLQPLIAETAERINNFSPAKVQTGPAARGDTATIDRHIQLLQNFPELQQFYQLFTQHILAAYNTN